MRNKKTFPTYEEFQNFLKSHLAREFNQGLYYTCAMAVLTGGPVSEGHGTDVDNYAPLWFVEFENRTGRDGIWTGKELLQVLQEVGPHPPEPRTADDGHGRRSKRQILVDSLILQRQEARKKARRR